MPIRTRTRPRFRPGVRASARWASMAANTALARVREGDEERIALGVDFVATVLGERLAHVPLVIDAASAGYRSRSRLTSCVDPSISVKRKVTAPLGSSVTR